MKGHSQHQQYQEKLNAESCTLIICMPAYLVLAAMQGRFVSNTGNTYDNFQFMGYSDGADPISAVTSFFDAPPYPIVWADVEYLWAERLADDSANGHLGDYERIYVETLRKMWAEDSS